MVVAPSEAKRRTTDKQLYWDGLCRLSLAGSGLVVIEAEEGATLEDLALAASGAGLALALEERNQLVLHGSCIAIGGRGVCLLGPSGAGKSTLAAALQVAGHVLVSDAMTALECAPGALPSASPGFPVLKLWPAAVNQLGLSAHSSALVHRDSEKRLCVASGQVAHEPVEVLWFVAVTPGTPVDLRPLGPADGALTLVRNSYLVDDTSSEEQPALLRRCVAAAQRARVVRLQRGDDLAQLKDVVGRLEALVQSTPNA